MNGPRGYITIPADDFGWLAAALYARRELGEIAALAVAILEAAGADGGKP